jgi:hypothetical protein
VKALCLSTGHENHSDEELLELWKETRFLITLDVHTVLSAPIVGVVKISG